MAASIPGFDTISGLAFPENGVHFGWPAYPPCDAVRVKVKKEGQKLVFFTSTATVPGLSRLSNAVISEIRDKKGSWKVTLQKDAAGKDLLIDISLSAPPKGLLCFQNVADIVRYCKHFKTKDFCLPDEIAYNFLYWANPSQQIALEAFTLFPVLSQNKREQLCERILLYYYTAPGHRSKECTTALAFLDDYIITSDWGGREFKSSQLSQYLLELEDHARSTIFLAATKLYAYAGNGMSVFNYTLQERYPWVGALAAHRAALSTMPPTKPLLTRAAGQQPRSLINAIDEALNNHANKVIVVSGPDMQRISQELKEFVRCHLDAYSNGDTIYFYVSLKDIQDPVKSLFNEVLQQHGIASLPHKDIVFVLDHFNEVINEGRFNPYWTNNFEQKHIRLVIPFGNGVLENDANMFDPYNRIRVTDLRRDVFYKQIFVND